MKTLFFIFAIFASSPDNDEYITSASNMQFNTVEACQNEVSHYQDTHEIVFFCASEELLMNNDTPLFY